MLTIDVFLEHKNLSSLSNLFFFLLLPQLRFFLLFAYSHWVRCHRKFVFRSLFFSSFYRFQFQLCVVCHFRARDWGWHSGENDGERFVAKNHDCDDDEQRWAEGERRTAKTKKSSSLADKRRVKKKVRKKASDDEYEQEKRRTKANLSSWAAAAEPFELSRETESKEIAETVCGQDERINIKFTK